MGAKRICRGIGKRLSSKDPIANDWDPDEPMAKMLNDLDTFLNRRTIVIRGPLGLRSVSTSTNFYQFSSNPTFELQTKDHRMINATKQIYTEVQIENKPIPHKVSLIACLLFLLFSLLF